MESASHFSRRPGAGALVVALLTVGLLACAPSAPSPTTAPPAKPTEATKPAPAAPSVSPVASAVAQPSPSPSPVASPGAAAGAPKPAAVTLPKPEQTALKIGHSTLEASQLSMVLARDAGLYQKYGFTNVELFYNEGDAKALQALVASQMDVSAQGASVAISSQLTDAPVIVVAMTSTKNADDLVTAADVKTPADLKGKSVAVSAFGGTSHASVLLALKGIGLTTNDVTLVQVGGQSARIAAMKAGSVAAAPVDVSMEDQMKQQGFNILYRLIDSPLETLRSGLIVRRDWADKNPNTVLALVAANLEAQQLMFTQTDQAVDSFVKWTQSTDRAAADKEVRAFLQTARRDMRWGNEAWGLARDVLATQNPAVASVDVTKGYSLQYLDRLKELGFNDAVGVPKS